MITHFSCEDCANLSQSSINKHKIHRLTIDVGPSSASFINARDVKDVVVSVTVVVDDVTRSSSGLLLLLR